MSTLYYVGRVATTDHTIFPDYSAVRRELLINNAHYNSNEGQYIGYHIGGIRTGVSWNVDILSPTKTVMNIRQPSDLVMFVFQPAGSNERFIAPAKTTPWPGQAGNSIFLSTHEDPQYFEMAASNEDFWFDGTADSPHIYDASAENIYYWYFKIRM